MIAVRPVRHTAAGHERRRIGKDWALESKDQKQHGSNRTSRHILILSGDGLAHAG